MAAATPPEVRKARAFLRSKGVTTQEIPPRKFANSAKELNRGFRELLRYIMDLRSGGQGQSQQRRSHIRQEADKNAR
jgi:hypothetical protein